MSGWAAQARATIRDRRTQAVLAALAGLGLGWLLANLAADGAAGHRYAAVAQHEANDLDTCYMCFRAIDLRHGAPAAHVQARYVDEWGKRVPVEIPVCSACTGEWDLAVKTAALENWKAVLAERMDEAERRGWVSPKLARRRIAVYRNAVVIDAERTGATRH